MPCVAKAERRGARRSDAQQRHGEETLGERSKGIAQKCAAKALFGDARQRQSQAVSSIAKEKLVKATRRQGNAHQCKGVEMLCTALAKFREGRRWNRKAMSAALRNGTDKHGGAMAQTRTDLRRQRAAFYSDGEAQTSSALA